MQTSPARKDLVGLFGLPRKEIVSILDEAAEMKRRLHESGIALDDLAGRTVCLLFFEPSTRTMNAFAAAARNLSAASAIEPSRWPRAASAVPEGR